MFDKPQDEHHRLEFLVGTWSFDSQCVTAPGAEPQSGTGRVKGRTLGGLWYQLETTGDVPEGEPWTTQMSLGYDPVKKKYIGTFIGSMMAGLWVYEGSFDADGKRLVLDTEGPKFEGPGTAKYQDIVEIVNTDHWMLKSQILGDDGKWTQFMTADYRRVG